MQGGPGEFRVLGPIEALVDGVAVELGGAQRRAVLAMLILNVGQAVSADTLAAGLWGDHPPASSRASVQVQVSRLRTVLPPGTIATRGTGYVLDVPVCQTDAGRAQELIGEARACSAAGDPAGTSILLAEALGLWRGPPLDDLGHAPFAPAAAVRLEELRLNAIEDRITADLTLGRHAAIVAELETLVREHPLRESLWGHLMIALYGSGRQADALRAFERARQHLSSELGLDPGPRLRELERAILDHALPAASAPGPADHRPSHDPLPERPARPRPAPGPALAAPDVLAGRQKELDVLRAALDCAAVGGGRGFVAVRGDEGLGKSSLVATFAAQVASQAVTVAGRCREHLAVPFAPWADLLLQLGAHDELALLEDDPTGETSAEWRRTRLFEGVVRQLRRASEAQPLLVVLDDLHWSDDGTISLLLYALDELGESPVLVIGTWRGREIAVSHPTVRLVHHVAKHRTPTVDLDPLTHHDIATLLQVLAPDAPNERTLAAALLVHEATSGVPLFVADALATGGTDVLRRVEDEGRARVPETARSIATRRIAQSGADAPAVAEACAVLAEPIVIDVLCELLPEIEPHRVLGALDGLVTSGLLREGAAGPTFSHAAFRSAVADSIGSGRRQVLHASAFRALSATDAPAAAVSHHAERAGRLVAAVDAADAFQRAGADAAARGAFVDAATFHGRAVALAPAATRGTAMVAHADALWRAGDLATAKGTAVSVAAMADAGDPSVTESTLADAVALHGTIGAGYGPDPESIDLARRALARTVDPLVRARCAVALAYHHAAWGSPAHVAHQALEEARDLRPHPCPEALAQEFAFAEGMALLDSPDVGLRLAQAGELIDRGRTHGAWRSIGRGLRLRGMAQLAIGALDDARATVDELLVVAERTGSWLYESDVWRWRGAMSLAAGDLDGMTGAIAELERLAASPLAGWVSVGTQTVLLRRARGDLDIALQMVDGIRAIMPDESPWQTDRRLADLFRLDLLVQMGRHEEARAELLTLRPYDELDQSSCRRYPAELALTARAVAVLEVHGPAPMLAGCLAPYGEQHVVLGWGEAVIDRFDACSAALAPLLNEPRRR